MLKPSNSGTFFSLDVCEKFSIDSLIKEVNKSLKSALLDASLKINKIDVAITTTNTRFGGEKHWFLCPSCNKRRGVLYRHPVENTIRCRICMGLKYKNQRYKGMIENSINKK
jgi:hypothetical protein